jgi:hypothetical protein
MALAMGTLVFQSNVPDNTACSTGYNLFNQLNFITGDAVTNVVTTFGSDSLAAGASLVMLDGSLKWIVTNADGTTKTFDVTGVIPGPVGKRVSWREIEQ